MSLKAHQGAAFGRRRAKHPQLARRTAKSSPRLVLVALAAWELTLAALLIGIMFWAMAQKVALQANEARAIQGVVATVNKPITHLPSTAAAAEFSQGWFHPGAIKPDFATVDVRQTQDLFYDKDPYVTWNLNPTQMFIGGELEFNAMTKYFYVDRTLPKGRLSEGEMLEINDLYRVIARSQRALDLWWKTAAGVAALGLFLVAAPLVVFRARSQVA